MSNASYSKVRYRKVSANSVANDFSEEQVEDEYTDEDVYEDYVDEADEEEVPAGSQLFSSPARTITLVSSALLLFLMAAVAAWLIGQSGSKAQPPKVSSNSAPGKLLPVPEINNSAAAYASKPSGLAEAARVGALPPNFQWVDNKTGQTVTLESLRGKPLLLNFWGTWCPPCRAEMPEMQKLYDSLGGSVNFLGVSMGPRDEPLNVSQFVQLNKYSWDFIHDPNSDVMNRYQVTGIPSSYYIDKNGVIRSITVGGADAQILRDNLQKAQQ
jgi:thiol-disulfide isomerase/thioredoxin